MTKLLSRLLRIAIACCLALPAMGQPTALIVRGELPDTCKVAVESVVIGKTVKELVLVPRSDFAGFDVLGSDTVFHYGPGPMNMRYRLCYEVKSFLSNCPWLSFQRYTPIKCE
jgi:hypothetical protein